MSSDEGSGADGRQRTVAELLAANGKQQDMGTPRRRRRRAEDATEETAPQAIIDRVRSDTGTLLPVDPDSPGPHESGHAAGHRAGHSTGHRKPVAPQAEPRPASPPQRSSGPAPTPSTDAPSSPGHVSPAAAPPTRRRPTPPPAQPGALGARLRGGAGARPVETHTEQFPAVDSPAPAAGTAPRSGEPPAGLPAREEAAAAQTQYSNAVAPDDDFAPFGDDTYRGQSHDAEAGAPSGAAADAARRASVANRLAGGRRPPAAEAEAEAADGFDAFGSGRAVAGGEAPDADEDYANEFADEDYANEFADEDYADDYTDEDYESDDYTDEEYDDYDDADYDDYEEDEASEDVPGSTREWLTLAGLVAASLVGGGAVWLGFDWFWGVLPAGALAGALVVIALMVWVVRRYRHAEDAQTMVLAVLAGLVMTVSPAALLLLDR